VYFALKAAAFYTQLLTQNQDTQQLISRGSPDWLLALRGLNLEDLNYPGLALSAGK